MAKLVESTNWITDASTAMEDSICLLLISRANCLSDKV